MDRPGSARRRRAARGKGFEKMTIAFRPGTVIDGTGAPPRERCTVLVDGDRISAFGARDDVGIPDGAAIVDAPGATLIPGLIDLHVHLAFSGDVERDTFRTEVAGLNYAEMALRAAGYAHRTLRAGFTTLRDVHAPGGVIIDLARAIRMRHVPGPTIHACGTGLSVTGGHMDQPGWADHVRLDGVTSPCDGPLEFRRGVRRQVKRGADLIKINACVSSLRHPDVPYRQEMTDEELEAACDEAHLLERHVAAHTSGGPGLTAAVRAGVDTIEHGHWIDRETADLMAESGTILVPTLLVNERNFEFPREELGGSDASWRWREQSRDAKWESLEIARRAGVKIGCGTDAGYMIPHGEMNAREIELLVQGGLSPVEAIRSATSIGAERLGIEAGVIAAGRVADLVLVAGDPVADIRVLQEPHNLRVFKGGVEVVQSDGEAV